MNEGGHDTSHSNVEFGYGGQMYLNDHVVNVVLFKSWKTSTWQELLLACLFTAVMGLLYEMFVVLRELLAWKVANEAKLEGSKEEKPNDEKTKLRDESKTRRFTVTPISHSLRTMLYFLQSWLALLVMLLAMTFNVYICLSITVSKAVGYFFFNWISDRYFKPSFIN